MIDDAGQISGEYLLLAGVMILILMMSAVFIYSEQELNIAMSAARNGINDGIASSSSAIYTKQAYNDYSKTKSDLLIPNSVEIVNVSYTEMGIDRNFDKKKIQFKVYATSSKDLSKTQLDSIGDRINYNLRKSIALSFNSTSSTNKLYNPVFSPHYVFTTANVKWV
ncbi:MAG: hypothetical protein E7Z81_03875 [Methanobrevibacter sp.]|uniref:hypothetical protein n=1 Tax=Methanobrevibacter sp. TaxID=66852 RepID=UPI0025F77126|nr:hypothetical protein [Methanobrevibacter sp.]MBE6497402.1 hypothetical protein [Methanobrevibacter sp.]